MWQSFFSQLLYIRLYHALLEMAGLGTTDRLDGIKRSHHASCHYRTRIHLVQSMDRHGFERRTGSLILYRASPSSLASDVQCRFLAKSTTSILAKGSGGITKTYSRKRTWVWYDSCITSICRSCTSRIKNNLSECKNLSDESVGWLRWKIPQSFYWSDGLIILNHSAPFSGGTNQSIWY